MTNHHSVGGETPPNRSSVGGETPPNRSSVGGETPPNRSSVGGETPPNPRPNPFAPSPMTSAGRPVVAEDLQLLSESPTERDEGGGLPIRPVLAAWWRRWPFATAVGLALAAVAAPAIWY